MVRHRLSEEQEREAKLLEAKIRAAVDKEIADLARLLVSKSESNLFGETELFKRATVVHPASGDAPSPHNGDVSCCLQGW